MNKLKIAAAVVLTLASATSSFAQSNKDEGFYGIANFGFTTTKGTGSGVYSDGQTHYTSTSSGAGNAWNLGLGYDFDKDFAVEGTIGNFWKHDDQYTDVSQWGTGTNDKKSNVMAVTLTGLYKYQISDNTKLFAGPTVAHLKAKFSDSYSYYGTQGYVSASSSSSSQSKTLGGLVLGAAFALDKKTDLRFSMTKYQAWKQSDGVNED